MKRPPNSKLVNLVRNLYRHEPRETKRSAIIPELTREDTEYLKDHLFFAVSKQGIPGWTYLANCLFFAIARHHGETTARRVFKECGPMPKRLRIAIRNATVLDRLDMMKPKPNVAQLARELAEENKALPRHQQRGVGGIDPVTLEGHIRDLVDRRNEFHSKR